MILFPKNTSSVYFCKSVSSVVIDLGLLAGPVLFEASGMSESSCPLAIRVAATAHQPLQHISHHSQGRFCGFSPSGPDTLLLGLGNYKETRSSCSNNGGRGYHPIPPVADDRSAPESGDSAPEPPAVPTCVLIFM